MKAPPDTISLRLISGAKKLELLPSFKHLKSLWCFDINDDKLEFISRCQSIESLYIENLRTPNLGRLRNLINLKLLGIETCSKPTSLDAIAGLKSLSGLAITHFKNVHDLGPLAELSSLRALAVGGSMWTRMNVNSFKPLEGLRNLEFLSLTNIKALDESLRPLGELINLKRLDIANFYPMREFAWLSQKLKSTECSWFEPFVDLRLWQCQKCSRSTMLMLTGKRKSRLCKLCDAGALEDHVQNWTQVTRKVD